jgi:galactonate dehydratase
MASNKPDKHSNCHWRAAIQLVRLQAVLLGLTPLTSSSRIWRTEMGFLKRRGIAAMAETYDIAVAPHCPLGAIALVACLQIDLVSQNFFIQERVVGIHYDRHAVDGEFDLLSYKDPSVFEVKNGDIVAFTKPGLGFDLDEELVRKGSMDAKAWRNP